MRVLARWTTGVVAAVLMAAGPVPAEAGTGSDRTVPRVTEQAGTVAGTGVLTGMCCQRGG
jgi:hypothetical protein